MKKPTVQLIVKMFRRLNHVTDQLYEIELVKSESYHREPIRVGFFILQYAKLIMLELHYSFFKKFCDTHKYEEPELDIESLYFALSEKKLEDVLPPKKRAEWNQLRAKGCTDNFTANATDSFSPKIAVLPTNSMIRESGD